MFIVVFICLMYILILKRFVYFIYYLFKLCYNIKRLLLNFFIWDIIFIIVDGMNSK